MWMDQYRLKIGLVLTMIFVEICDLIKSIIKRLFNHLILISRDLKRAKIINLWKDWMAFSLMNWFQFQ